MWECVHEHACEGQRLSFSITLRLSFLRQTLSQSLELTHWLCVLLSPPSVTSPELWLQVHTTLVLRFWTYISSHAYKEVSSLIELCFFISELIAPSNTHFMLIWAI